MDKNKILNILGKIINVEQLFTLPGDTILTDIGMNSLAFIQFIVALEEKFGFEILDSDLLPSNFQTIDMLFHTLEKYFNTGSTLKKVLICDCDNCLWHGIAGEEEIHTDTSTLCLQNELIGLYEKGILLCLCSKNAPLNIARAFAQLDMPLKPEHILLSKINHGNKADNIIQIAEELNLSTDSFVFLDDSDYELGLINALLPEVTTFKVNFEQLNKLMPEIRSCFGKNTSEPNRTSQYRDQKEREKAKSKYTTVEEYNASLETIVTCAEASPQQADRIAELSQRTNQCNLSVARYTPEDIQRMLADNNYTILSLSVEDKYGDMGIVGAAIIHSQAVIEAFFLSCRAFDRTFEDVLLQHIQERFPSNLRGVYKKSLQNIRYYDFYRIHGVPYYEK